MSRTVAVDKNIDVICQHTKDGLIVPLKIRLMDEDGVYQNYVIKAYKDRSFHDKNYTMPNRVNVNSRQSWIFDCKIQVFDSSKLITIIYNTYDGIWRLSI